VILKNRTGLMTFFISGLFGTQLTEDLNDNVHKSSPVTHYRL
jgi:hypothetical protein